MRGLWRINRGAVRLPRAFGVTRGLMMRQDARFMGKLRATLGKALQRLFK
jgi:hypothetical protein